MANHKSAEKRVRQNAKRRDINRSNKSKLRSSIKKLRSAVAGHDKTASTELLFPTVSLIDKANVLPSMAYFRGIFDEIAAEFPDVRTERIYVDAAALYLVQQPQRFDVMVTENMFGDILSDLTGGLVGGMGMAPSADIGDKYAVFQPSHGSAPDIAGQGIANPTATILSVAMMLEWFATEETKRGAALINRAVAQVFSTPENRTRDLGGTLSTAAMGDLIVQQIQ